MTDHPYRTSLCLLTSCLLFACSASGSITPQPAPTSSPTSGPTASPMPTASPAASYSYTFPLTATARPECGGTEQLLYEVRSDRTFRYYPGDYNPFSDEPTQQLVQRQLSQLEFDQLKALIEQADLARKFENSTPVPEDAPHTDECRTVLEFALQVNGETRTYDANGRKYNHTQAYRDAADSLRQRLQELSQVAVS